MRENKGERETEVTRGRDDGGRASLEFRRRKWQGGTERMLGERECGRRRESGSL